MTTETDLQKFCTDCGEEKPLSEFSTNGLNADGTQRYYSKCKPCGSKAVSAVRAGNKGYYAEYQAARSAALRELAQKHPEEYKALLAKHLQGKG